ncbi:MAG: 4Fe-4S binding protein [Christensenellales bacterium]
MRAQAKACTGCGKCASLCPVGAIPSRDPSQTLETLCITCMRCVAVCPVHARRLSPLVVKLAGRKLKEMRPASGTRTDFLTPSVTPAACQPSAFEMV